MRLTDGALRDILAALKYLAVLLFPRAQEVKDNPIINPPSNTNPVKIDNVIETSPKTSPADQLKITFLAWIGKDASPRNRAPKEVSCAEGIVNLINLTFPGTFDPSIVGTDALDYALRRSKRFKPVLDPLPGDIIVFPRTLTVNGHALGCVEIVKGVPIYASNDSSDGLFKRNYDRFTARKEFIGRRGLKGHIYRPI